MYLKLYIYKLKLYIYVCCDQGKKQRDYTFIPTSLFRDCSLIRGFYYICMKLTVQLKKALLKKSMTKRKVSEDPRDLEPPTPNHLPLLKSGSVLPPGTFRKEDILSCRRWR